jgi:hypothetical protein
MNPTPCTSTERLDPTLRSPIGLYLVVALAASGESIQTFIELSSEQEVNHGGVEGAAREGYLELVSLGHVGLQFVGAIPVRTEDERRELVEQWERLDQIEVDEVHRDRLLGL